MSKAFDRVNWQFIIITLKSFGFSDHWCDLIFQCISTPSITVLLNGHPCENVSLSPYLFILSMEVFSRLLLHLESKNKVQGIRLTKTAPNISHLFFADDLLLFTKANLDSCKNLMDAINMFSLASGQVVNFEKLGIFFSKKVHKKHQEIMSRLMKIKKMDIKDTHLGVPLFIDISKLKNFDSIIEKLEQRVKTWLGNTIPQPSRMVLNKSVLSGMPIYNIGCFVLLKKIMARIIAIQRDFWWGKKSNSKGIYIKSFEFMCKPINQGGLGFKDANKVNQAMISRIA